MREIAVLRTLADQHIVRYIGCAVEGSTFNIFEEYVSGGSISSILSKYSL